jgi:hypothetical protein
LEGRLAERSGAVFRLAGLTQRLEDETVAVGDGDGLAELTSLIEGPGEPGPSYQRMREISEWWEVSCEDCSALRSSSRGIGSGGGHPEKTKFVDLPAAGAVSYSTALRRIQEQDVYQSGLPGGML